MRINLPPLTRGLLFALLAFSTINAILRTRKWTTLIQTQTPPTTTTTTSTKLVKTAADYLTSPSLAVPYLVLVPTKSVRYPWTFLTAALVENNAVSLAISGSVLWFGGRYLERAWGSKEFAKFVVFVTVIPNILTFCIYAIWHLITSTPELYVVFPKGHHPATCLRPVIQSHAYPRSSSSERLFPRSPQTAHA